MKRGTKKDEVESAAPLLDVEDGKRTGNEENDNEDGRKKIKFEFSIPKCPKIRCPKLPSLPRLPSFNATPSVAINDPVTKHHRRWSYLSFFLNAVFLVAVGVFFLQAQEEPCVFEASLTKDHTGSYSMQIRPEPGQPDTHRTLCMVMTHYPNTLGMSAVMNTWGLHCDGVTFFVVTAETVPDTFGTAKVINLISSVGDQHKSSNKAHVAAAFLYVHYALTKPGKVENEEFYKTFNWFSKCSIDTFVIPENMRRMVSSGDPTSLDAFFGDTLHEGEYGPKSKKEYVRGTGHYVMGRALLQVLGDTLITYFNAKAPCDVEISGRKGYNEILNGVYLKGEVFDRHFYYEHETNDLILYFLSQTGQWAIGKSLGSKEDVYAFGESHNDGYPDTVTGVWQIWSDSRTFQPDPNVQIHCAHDTEPRKSPRTSPYKYYGTPKTFDGASKHCKDEGYQLTSIHDETEMREIYHICQDGGDKQCWIGNRANPAKPDPDAFKWADTSSLDFTNWAPGHPSESGDFAMCGRVVPEKDSMEWYETDCSHTYAFVCNTLAKAEDDASDKHTPEHWCDPFGFGEHEELMVSACLSLAKLSVQRDAPSKDEKGREYIFHKEALEVPRILKPNSKNTWWHPQRGDLEGTEFMSPYPVSFGQYSEKNEILSMYYHIYGIHLYGRIDDGSEHSEIILGPVQE